MLSTVKSFLLHTASFEGVQNLKKIKWPLLALAILATLCIMGIGIAVAEESIIGIFAAIIGLIVAMGFGFKTKKKMRENGIL